MDAHREVVQPLGDEVLDTMKVAPFGDYGAGIWTGHPIGLVILIGLIVTGFAVFPETAWFFALAILAGAIWGFFMWSRHQRPWAGH